MALEKPVFRFRLANRNEMKTSPRLYSLPHCTIPTSFLKRDSDAILNFERLYLLGSLNIPATVMANPYRDNLVTCCSNFSSSSDAMNPSKKNSNNSGRKLTFISLMW